MDEDVIISFPEWPVNLFDVDCTGNWAALAVQKWLAIISLSCTSGVELGSGEGREKAKRKLGTHNKYEIKSINWNPHVTKQQLLATTNHQKLDVWDTHGGRDPLFSIKAHTRPLSDVNWSLSDSNLVATCAVDSYVHIWDIRDSKRPKVSFKTLGGLNSGASLVRWNRLNGSVIASAHDSDIRIWDMKKPSTVTSCITAHMNKIHDLDWSYANEHQLTSCSHDATIKFWDTVTTPREPSSTIKTGTHPIWRSKNSPYGEGVAMIIVPAVHSGDSRVFLWNRTNITTPIHIFPGHSDNMVVDIKWKRQKNCQLMSLSKDHTLCIHSLDEQLQADLSMELSDIYTSEREQVASLKITSTEEAETSFSIEPVQSERDRGSSVLVDHLATPAHHATTPSTSNLFNSSHSQTLAQEFTQVNLDIPNLEMERMDASQRSCTVKLEQGDHVLRLGITFPSHYPNGAAPSFISDASTTIGIANQQELIRVVNETAYTNVRVNRPCLELCLRRLAKSFETLLCRPDPPTDPHQTDFDISFGKLDDDRIPFPRSSGARFCSNGYIVCFSWPSVVPPDQTTPKSLDYFHQYKSHMRGIKGSRQRSATLISSSRTSSGNSLQSMGQSPLVFSKDKRKSGGSGNLDNMCSSAVIYDISNLLPIDYNLAKSYSLIGRNIQELCIINASTAALFSRPDLVNTWTVLSLIADSPINNSKGPPWAMHPFGRQLLQSLFEYYSELHDVQMLAMMACICQLQCLNVAEHFTDENQQHSTTPPPQANPSTNPLTKRNQVEAWETVVIDDGGTGLEGEEETEAIQHQYNCRLLDRVMSWRCDEYMRYYGDILYRWGLLTQRSEVMKYQSSSAPSDQIVMAGQCKGCLSLLETPFCKKCKTFAITCVLCNVAVKGCTNLCLNCGHGGHTHHLMEWFADHVTCPSGCGCNCLEMSGWSQ